ncbi:hypothetical protein [uncultured Flavobacterium sp.]|uniref:hypothetical protein n=1 Tax=uncultured Flavobacterium sp. TaxID=165435 RepID=UPI003747EC79
MLKVIFYQKSDKVDKNGESSIFARLSYKTKKISISTGKSISKERWGFTNNLRNVLKLEKKGYKKLPRSFSASRRKKNSLNSLKWILMYH